MKTVWIDLDGVLAAHDKYVESMIGLNYTQLQLNELHQDKNFFYKLEKTDMADIIIETVVSLFGQYNILTTSSKDYAIDGCLAKMKWIKEKINPAPHSVIFTRNKEYWANPDSILIDDYGVNIINWNMAGGIGIKFIADHKDYLIENLIKRLGDLK